MDILQIGPDKLNNSQVDALDFNKDISNHEQELLTPRKIDIEDSISKVKPTTSICIYFKFKLRLTY